MQVGIIDISEGLVTKHTMSISVANPKRRMRNRADSSLEKAEISSEHHCRRGRAGLVDKLE